MLSMGPPQVEAALREAISLGADEAYLLTDRSFAGADTLATAYTLAAGIKKFGDVDIILMGRQAIDGFGGLYSFHGILDITGVHSKKHIWF